MSISMAVEGFYPRDEEWDTMAKVWGECEAAGLEKPVEVIDYFDVQPDEDSVLGKRADDIQGAISEWIDPEESSDGVIIDISKLPPGVTFLRISNCY